MKALAPLLALAAVGCSAAFNRAAMSDQLWEGEKVFTDADVARIEQLKPQLSIPFRLAIAPPLREDWHGGPPRPGSERAEVVGAFEPLVNALVGSGVVSEVIFLPRMLLGTPVQGRQARDYFKAVRVAAARVQADAVLLLSSVTEVEAGANLWSLLDLTLIGTCLAPGHTLEALTLLEGILIDNRNEYVYWTGSVEGTGISVGSLMGVREDKAVRDARGAALAAFGALLSKEAPRLKPGPPGPRYDTPGR